MTFSAAKGSLTKKISISIKFPHAILLFIFYVKPLKEPVHFLLWTALAWPVHCGRFWKLWCFLPNYYFHLAAFICFESGPFLSLPLWGDFVYGWFLMSSTFWSISKMAQNCWNHTKMEGQDVRKIKCHEHNLLTKIDISHHSKVHHYHNAFHLLEQQFELIQFVKRVEKCEGFYGTKGDWCLKLFKTLIQKKSNIHKKILQYYSILLLLIQLRTVHSWFCDIFGLKKKCYPIVCH